MEIPLLTEVVVILGLSVLIILVFQKLRVPSILGFLLTGALVGPSGLSLVKAVHEVEILAEIGVILLLFVIGIEFSLKSLVAIRRTVLLGGSLQVGGTILLTALISYALGLGQAEAVFMGFLIALSSTAIVLKLLQQRGEIATPHGRIAVGILIFQDIIVVPMMLLAPILSGQSEDVGMTLLLMLGKFVGVLGIIILLARYVVPYLLRQIVKTRSNELFLLSILVMCFATAWLTASVGLSLALGAFFAGLVISESPYHHQATAIVLPFREVFVSFFFVSVGMLLDLGFFGMHLPGIVLLTVGVVVVKVLVIMLTVVLLRYPARTVLLSALTLFQVGEFAFILSVRGLEYDLISQANYQYFLAISIVTMALTPFVIQQAGRIAKRLERRIPSRIRQRMEHQTSPPPTVEPVEVLRDHLIIIGYGINGRNLARAARQADIPFQIIEFNAETVRQAQAEGEPIVYGDAAQEVILQHCHVQEARVIVIAISDPEATKRIIVKVRELTQAAYLLVRTRYVTEIAENMRLGANAVIPEEFETSIEIFSRVLRKYLVPRDRILTFAQHIRAQNYEVLREIDAPSFSALDLPDVEIFTLEVKQGENKIVGRSLADLNLRHHFGITILAIRRGESYITQVGPEERILPDDMLHVFGPPEAVVKLNSYFE